MKKIPLSAFSTVPVTAETLAALHEVVEINDKFDDAEVARLTEQEAQVILALRRYSSEAEVVRPSCYGDSFGQVPTCHGCIFAARCWSADYAYLRRVAAGEADPPPFAVPDKDLKAAIALAADRVVPAPPPKRTKRPPPPPPRKA